MKLRRVKLVWGAAEAIKGHWRLGLFGVYERDPGSRVKGYAISVRGALAWLGGAAVVAYVTAATALFWFWQKNPYSLLTYKDALLRPVRTAQVRDLQGQAFIAQGTDALRAKRYAEAIALLRQGLTYHPNDFKARLTLAQFYVAVNQRPMALKIMQEALGEEYPGRIFLQGLFDVAEQGEDYDLVVRLSDQFLPRLQGEANAVDRRWVQLRKFGALVGAARFADALTLANSEDPGDMSGEHRVIALLGAGRQTDALAALAEWGARPGADDRAVLRLRARALREARRFDEMDDALEKLRARSPADPRPQVFAIVQRAMGGRDAAALAGFNDFIFRFGGTTQNLQLIAEPLAEIGQVGLVERCAAAAAERGYPLEPFHVLLVQVYLQAGDWAAAHRTFGAMKPPAATGRAAAASQAWHDWMQRLIDATATTSETAGPALVEILRQRPWPMKIFRKSIEALRLADRLDTARDVVALAGGAFPASAWLVAQRDEIKQTLEAREAAKATASTAVPVAGLPPESIYFKRLETLLNAGDWALAEQLLRDARTAKPPPSWLASRDGDLRFAQVRICRGRGEFTALLAAARIFLNGEADRSRRITDVARAIYAQGEKATATKLAREVLRALPDYPPADRLLRDWQQTERAAKAGDSK